ncbi:MAG: hypothetical protein ABGW74_05120 [Campylobacterales bacterium]
MPKLDKLKEELGWLKVVFSILIATNLSLIAWFVQNYEKQKISLTLLNGIIIVVLTFIIFIINKKAYKKIDEIGEI